MIKSWDKMVCYASVSPDNCIGYSVKTSVERFAICYTVHAVGDKPRYAARPLTIAYIYFCALGNSSNAACWHWTVYVRKATVASRSASRLKNYRRCLCVFFSTRHDGPPATLWKSRAKPFCTPMRNFYMPFGSRRMNSLYPKAIVGVSIDLHRWNCNV